MIISSTEQISRHAEQERGFALTQIIVNVSPFPVSFFIYYLYGSRRQIFCPLRPCGSVRIRRAGPVSQDPCPA